MSTTKCEPARPADEAGIPHEARGSSVYAVTLAALEAALAESAPAGGMSAALPTTGV